MNRRWMVWRNGRKVEVGPVATRPRPTPTGARVLPIAIVATALAGAAIGVVEAAGHLAVSQQPPATTVTLDGLTTQVGTAGWIALDHDMPMADQGGYQMPAQMMPGAPSGDDVRLSVPVTLRNTSRAAVRFNLAEEFFLRGGDGERRSLTSNTFEQLSRLAPGTAVNGVLYFDARPPAPGEPPLYLEWRHSGDSGRLEVRLPGTAPEHGHG